MGEGRSSKKGGQCGEGGERGERKRERERERERKREKRERESEEKKSEDWNERRGGVGMGGSEE